MAVKAGARSQETVTLKTKLPHPVCSFRVFLSHPLSLSLSVCLVLSFRFIYSRYKLKEAVERHFGWYRKGISATAAGTRPDEKRPTRRMVFHRLPAALLAVRQCSETNDVLVVHLLHGRWRAGTSATTSITRRALTSLDASVPRAEGRDTGGKKKRTRRTKVSLSQRFFPMKRCAVASEENKGTPAQQRPGWDYFADFTCYGSGYSSVAFRSPHILQKQAVFQDSNFTFLVKLSDFLILTNESQVSSSMCNETYCFLRS